MTSHQQGESLYRKTSVAAGLLLLELVGETGGEGELEREWQRPCGDAPYSACFTY